MTRRDTAPERATMKDVSHTPPWGEAVTNVWERGLEHPENRDEPVTQASD